MNSIEKFINFLNVCLEIVESNIDYAKKVNERLYKAFLNPITFSSLNSECEEKSIMQMLHFLGHSKEELLETHMLFTSYSVASIYLDGSNLNAKEKMEIIMHILFKNCYVLLKDSQSIPVIFDQIIFKNFYAPDMDINEFEEFMQTIDIMTILKSNNPLDKKSLKIKEKIIQTLEHTITENKKFIKAHKIMSEHYFTKLDDFDKKDLQFICVALKILNVSPKIQSSILRILNKVIENRKPIQNPVEKEVKNYDYNAMCIELNTLIDFNEMWPKKALSKEEEIRVLFLLLKLNISKEQIYLFLRNSDTLRWNQNPLLKYMESFEKYNFYKSSVGIQKELKYMEDCFQESIICDFSDYMFWKENLDNEIKKIENWIPKNFEYEFVEARKLSKK